MDVAQAGRLGGLEVLRKRGNAHFAEIGKQGQKTMRAKYPQMASEWGKKGGRPRKINLGERMSFLRLYDHPFSR
jgi:hypothetical protein